jgi:hypothetical protein
LLIHEWCTATTTSVGSGSGQVISWNSTRFGPVKTTACACISPASRRAVRPATSPNCRVHSGRGISRAQQRSEPRDENESAPSRGLRSPPSGGHYSGVVNVPFLELKPTYDELRAEVDAAYRRVMDSGWYIFGPEITAFESEYAASVGVHHVIAVAK